ncbi:MAG: protease [Myxococcales bacterium]|nr:protease [Myxococcales bacterium]
MLNKSIILAFGCSAFAFGCTGEGSEGDTQEIIDNLVQAGYPVSDTQVIDGKVFVGNDAEVSLQASREMLGGSTGDEQFRTFNLVGGPNPSAICVNGAAFAANATLSQGFDLALGNYNALFNAGTSRLAFFRVNGGPVPGCNFFINGFVQAGLVGGFAGFPSGGAPFGQITIGDGVVQFGLDVTEHVITHELGHTIGFRHSDFFNRSISCGGAPINEENPPSGLGAVLIAGTPNGSAVGLSLMNSCFRATENGELTPTDVIAVNTLY